MQNRTAWATVVILHNEGAVAAVDCAELLAQTSSGELGWAVSVHDDSDADVDDLDDDDAADDNLDEDGKW